MLECFGNFEDSIYGHGLNCTNVYTYAMHIFRPELDSGRVFICISCTRIGINRATVNDHLHCNR